MTAAVRERLGRGDLADLLPRDRPDLDRLSDEAAGIRERLRTLPAEYVTLGLDPGQVAEANRAGRARLAELEAALGSPTRGGALGQLLACEDPVALWDGIPDGQVSRRQAIVRCLFTVTLGAPVRGKPPADWATSVAWYGGQCVRVGPPAAA